ncbi:MAG TPA: nucleotidyltransferase domain-containing protein [Bacteriovoracaceae bacterium]|nr:nucleotidyltransferase domain-containing protein [Bacteriovoracaceae bacterium]
MKSFGLKKEEIALIKEKIQKVFGEKTDLKVYLFGSRATGKNKKNSDIDLALKSKDPAINTKISTLKNELEESQIPYKIDLINWDVILKEYLPGIRKQKVPFWDKKQAVVVTPWRLCPLGEHWVIRHPKSIKSGKITDHDGHCRRNPKGKDILKSDEIKKISELEIFKKVSVKASYSDLKYPDGNKYNDLINGWCAYWNEMLIPDEKLHPNYVKALLATESGFNINPPTFSKNHKAIGIMQIMPETIGYVSSRSKDLKDHFLEITKEDLKDPNIAIAVAIRWLFRKYQLVKRKKKNATWLDSLEEYKGITDQKGKVPSDIRESLKSKISELEGEL